MFCVKFAKDYNCERFFINLFYILPKILLSSEISGQMDIRYPAFRLAGYPAKTVLVSGASLVFSLFRIFRTGTSYGFAKFCKI
jgi:hypothetical protein